MENESTRHINERKDEKGDNKSKILGRRGFDKIVYKVSRPSHSHGGSGGQQTSKICEEDARREIERVKQEIARLDKSLDKKFSKVHFEIKKLSDDLDYAKSELENDSIIPDIKALMTTFARHDFKSDFVSPREDVYYPLKIKSFTTKKLS